MSIESSSTASPLEEFEIRLRTDRYAAAIQRGYLWIAQRFVDYLGRKCIHRYPQLSSSCHPSFSSR
jgi:hypothetical protein